MNLIWIASEKNKEFIKNKKLVLNSQKRFKSKKHNVFAEEVLII